MLNHLKNYLKNIICISLVLFATADTLQSQSNTEAETGSSFIVFLPFKDASSYDGVWNLKTTIPNYIANYIEKQLSDEVVSTDKFILEEYPDGYQERDFADIDMLSQIAKSLFEKNNFSNQTIVFVTGRITGFSISRFNAGEGSLGGYENYTCTIELITRLMLFDKINIKTGYPQILPENFSNSASRNGLGLTIFGKPSTERREFYGLNRIKFGSDEFEQTLVAEVMQNICKDFFHFFSKSVDGLTKKGGEDKPIVVNKNLSVLKTTSTKGIILQYDEVMGDAFVNLGADNDLRIGDDLLVYAETDSLFDPVSGEFLGIAEKVVGTMRVIELRGEKLSLCRATENREKIIKGSVVRKKE